MLFDIFPFEIIIYILNKCLSIDIINCTKLDRVNRYICIDYISYKNITLEKLIKQTVDNIRKEYSMYPETSYYFDIALQYQNKSLIEFYSLYHRYNYICNKVKKNTFVFYLDKGIKRFTSIQIEQFRKLLNYNIDITLDLFGKFINTILYMDKDKLDILFKYLDKNTSRNSKYIMNLINKLEN